jgi:outer membrane immunogenic protein
MISPCDSVIAAGGDRDGQALLRLRSFAGRLALCVLLAAISAAGASAADLDGTSLRGSYSNLFGNGPVRWDGWNFGGQIGYSSMATDFGNSNSSEIAYILRNTTIENEDAPSSWTTLPNASAENSQWGGFLGYSWQDEQLVYGVDLAFNHVSKLQSSASDALSRIVTTSDTNVHNVTIQSSAYINLLDYGTLRARVGYAFGQFLPYAFMGAAVGRFDYASSATVTDDITSGPQAGTNFGPESQSNGKTNAYDGGFDVGLGIDVAVLPNVFVRGEYEYIAWAPLDGMRTSTSTLRAGIGVRF